MLPQSSGILSPAGVLNALSFFVADRQGKAERTEAMPSLTTHTDRTMAWLSSRGRGLSKVGLAIAVAALCGGLYLALRSIPDALERLEALPVLAILFFCVPATTILSTLEFRLMTVMA